MTCCRRSCLFNTIERVRETPNAAFLTELLNVLVCNSFCFPHVRHFGIFVICDFFLLK